MVTRRSLAKNMLKAYLSGNKEARGLTAVKLEDEVGKQYKKILAEVRLLHHNLNDDQSAVDYNLIILLEQK